MMFAQQTQIIVSAVHDQFVPHQRVEQGIEIDRRQRVDEIVTGDRADLDQANLFRVGVQAVRLCIDSDPGATLEAIQEFGQFCFRINHARTNIQISTSSFQRNFKRHRWRQTQKTQRWRLTEGYGDVIWRQAHYASE